MKVLICSTAVALATLAMPCFAQNVPVYGYGGSNSCGAWVDARKNPNGVTAKLYLAWITGYVSGASMHGPLERVSDVDGLATYMDNACQKEPLIPMVTAAKRLVDALTGQHAQ